MCGRYSLARNKKILAEFFDFDNEVGWSPRYNIARGQSVAVIRQDATRPIRSFSLMRWGVIRFWAKGAKIGYKMINARAQTVAANLGTLFSVDSISGNGWMPVFGQGKRPRTSPTQAKRGLEWATRPWSLERFQVYSPEGSRHGYLISLGRERCFFVL
jgi:hypothetical protein